MRYARVLSAMLLLLGAAGCPWTEPAPRLPLIDPAAMDLVVGDMGLQTDKSEASWELEQPKVLVYFDVLNAALEDSSVQPAADLVLGIPDPAEEKAISVGNPVDVELNEGDLYLVDQSARRVYIWRDYRSHSDYDEPDVTLLANVSSSQGPWELFVAEGCLFVTDFYRGLLVWQNAATIETDDLPDIAIAPDAARNMLSGVELDENGHLFVSWLSGGMEVYYDFMDEYLADAAIEADVTLSGPSFSNMTAADLEGTRREQRPIRPHAFFEFDSLRFQSCGRSIRRAAAGRRDHACYREADASLLHGHRGGYALRREHVQRLCRRVRLPPRGRPQDGGRRRR